MAEEPTIRYQIRHKTSYQYGGRIDLGHNVAVLEPCTDATQEVSSFELQIEPEVCFLSRREDWLGNQAHYFEISESHQSLDVISISEVEKRPPVALAELPSSVLEGITWPACDQDDDLLAPHRLESQACPFRGEPLSGMLLEFGSLPKAEPGQTVFGYAMALTTKMFEEFQYVPSVTTTETTVQALLVDKRGVCQDFAHVMLSVLRQQGIPARYVSGYLETQPPPGQEKLQGADATHAWVEVFDPLSGWVGFDPTNNCPAGPAHLKVAHGRDYFDVQPVRGTVVGSGLSQLAVEVDVIRAKG